jgi:hypothetical protein
MHVNAMTTVTTSRTIPFSRFAVVAAAGMVGFLAFWQGFFSLIYYRPCALQSPSYVIAPNLSAAAAELGLAMVALGVLFWGAQRLRDSFTQGFFGYALVVASLLVSESLLAFIFLRLSTCAG